jgi:hypothetical protein
MVLEAEQRLLKGAADGEAILVDEEGCLADVDDLWIDVMVLIVVNVLSEEDNLLEELLVDPFVLTDRGVDDEMGSEFEVLLDLPELDISLELEETAELEEAIVAACWELKTETMEAAIADVLTEEVEGSVLLADLSCGLAE